MTFIKTHTHTHTDEYEIIHFHALNLTTKARLPYDIAEYWQTMSMV